MSILLFLQNTWVGLSGISSDYQFSTPKASLETELENFRKLNSLATRPRFKWKFNENIYFFILKHNIYF